MIVTVKIEIDFEKVDGESCGLRRAVEIAHKKSGWDAVGETIGMALKQLSPPRESETLSDIVLETLSLLVEQSDGPIEEFQEQWRKIKQYQEALRIRANDLKIAWEDLDKMVDAKYPGKES